MELNQIFFKCSSKLMLDPSVIIKRLMSFFPRRMITKTIQNGMYT